MLGTISLVSGLASSAYDWWQSEQQRERADELARNNVRPTMTIPKSEQESLGSARHQAALTRLPGQSAIEGRLDKITADQVGLVERQGVGGPTSINAASRAYGDQQDKEVDLGVASANMRLHNQDILRNELDENAQWEQKVWDWNTGQPYLDKQKAIAALRGAHLANQNTAVKNLIGTAANAGIMGVLGDDGKIGGEDGWFDSPKITNPVSNPYDFSKPISIDKYQNNDQNTAEYNIQENSLPMNFTDKMLTNPFWGN